jgi:hypothetical protein
LGEVDDDADHDEWDSREYTADDDHNADEVDEE